MLQTNSANAQIYVYISRVNKAACAGHSDHRALLKCINSYGTQHHPMYKQQHFSGNRRHLEQIVTHAGVMTVALMMKSHST